MNSSRLEMKGSRAAILPNWTQILLPVWAKIWTEFRMKTALSTMFKFNQIFFKILKIKLIMTWSKWEIIKENKTKITKIKGSTQIWLEWQSPPRLQQCDRHTTIAAIGMKERWMKMYSGKISRISSPKCWSQKLWVIKEELCPTLSLIIKHRATTSQIKAQMMLAIIS